MDVSIIIVSYNTESMTLECLHSLFETTSGLAFEVIVVDNGSKDGSVRRIREFPRAITLLPQELNLGFGAACNLAERLAKGRYLLLLNPDTLVLPGAVEGLYRFALDHPSNGIYGGRTLYPDGTLNPGSCYGHRTIWSAFCNAVGLSTLLRSSAWFNPEGYGGWKRDSVREVDVVTGCFLMIDRSVWHELGGFDEAFFMYCEDADLCLRAARLGHRPMITPDAVIVHRGGGSEPVRADKLVRLLRASGLLLDRHWPPPMREIGRSMLRAWVVVRWLGWTVLQVTGVSGSSRKAHEYGEVWRRRNEWSTR